MTEYALPRNSSACIEARKVVGEHLTRWPPERRGVASLLANELVANALEHGQGQVRLDLAAQERLLRVTVSDEGNGVPTLVRAPPAAERGRGLYLVDQLATRWGVSTTKESGTSVWFELEQSSGS